MGRHTDKRTNMNANVRRGTNIETYKNSLTRKKRNKDRQRDTDRKVKEKSKCN